VGGCPPGWLWGRRAHPHLLKFLKNFSVSGGETSKARCPHSVTSTLQLVVVEELCDGIYRWSENGFSLFLKGWTHHANVVEVIPRGAVTRGAHTFKAWQEARFVPFGQSVEPIGTKLCALLKTTGFEGI